MRLETLQRNSQIVQQDIKKACEHSHRSVEDVTVVCVTKSVDNETTEQMVDLGMEHLAENRMEKLLEKQDYLKDFHQIKWHFIGTLQKRKVKSVINKIDYFHALDKLSLAEEIQKRAEKPIKCFVQVNVSGESSKQGISPESLDEFISNLSSFDRIKVIGLMTMAPIKASHQELSKYFNKLKSLQQHIAEQNLSHAPCQNLSMGMSQDFVQAIECGATFVRIGSKYFVSEKEG